MIRNQRAKQGMSSNVRFTVRPDAKPCDVVLTYEGWGDQISYMPFGIVQCKRRAPGFLRALRGCPQDSVGNSDPM